MADDTYRFLLRMPTELREALRGSAAEAGRSLNSEIVARLELSLASPSRAAARVGAYAAAATLALAALGASVAGAAVGAGYASLQGKSQQGAAPIEPPALRLVHPVPQS